MNDRHDPAAGALPWAGALLLRLARAAVLAYPPHFRRRYGAGLLQNSRDLVRAAAEAGTPGVLRLAPRLLHDLITSGLAERSRQLHLPSPEKPAMFDTLLQDIRYALGAMRRRPALSALAVLTLALGIGASASMFSILDAVLLRSLPYPEPDRLMSLYPTIPEWQGDPVLDKIWDRAKFSYDEFEQWQERQQAFTAASVFAYVSANSVGLGPAEQVRVGLGGIELLPMLGAIPVEGRLFAEADRQAATRVAVLDFGFWRDRFGADAAALGRTITLDAEPYTVIGVLPDGFTFGRFDVDVWLPVYENRPFGYYPGNTGDEVHQLNAVGHLRPGVSPEQASAELATLLEAIGGPDHFTTHGGRVVPRLVDMTESVRYPLLVLMGAVILLLLVACANVATFLVGQAIDRQQEIAVREALGAGRLRIARQLLTESLVLASIGGILGLLLASQGVRLLAALAPADLPRLGSVAVNWRALVFTLAASTLSGVLFGLAPTLSLVRANLARTLGAARFGSASRSRLQAAMIVGEVAVATVLLIGAGLFVRSFLALDAVDPGFEPASVLRVDISPDTSGFIDAEGTFQPAAMERFLDGVGERLRAVPGVDGAAVAQIIPFSGGNANNNVTGEGYDGADGWQTIANRRFVDPGFHRMLEIELLDGRLLTEADNQVEAASVVLVSESLARRFWAPGEAVGRMLNWWGQDSEVVGVVADIHERDLAAEPEMTFYAPRVRWSQLGGDFLLAASGDPDDVIDSVRAALASDYPDLVVIGVEPLSDLVAGSLAEARYRARLIGVFALLAVVLSALGLYAVTSRAVASRTREIGIRVALGAERRRVVSMLVRHGVRLATFGTAAGIVVALGAGRMVAGLLFGLDTYDPVTILLTAGTVVSVALVASVIPSLRAVGLDTVQALRND